MSAYNLTFFLGPNANARGYGVPNPVLYVEPDRQHPERTIALQIPSGCTPEERVRIAEAFLKGVTAWRDAIVDQVERERTALDELAEARAEIARLKGEANGDAEAGDPS